MRVLGRVLAGLMLMAALVSGSAEAFREDARLRGNPNAPVTIIEYSDFTCGFCAKFFQETWPILQSRYIDTGKVRYYYRDFPRADQGPGVVGALASRCAGEQGRFWQMHDRLFSPGADLEAGSLAQDAERLGLNSRKFLSCLRDGAYLDAIFADREEGRRWGFRGTPGFVILLTQDMSGRQTTPVTVPGAFPYEVFQEQIEEFLRRSPGSAPQPSLSKHSETTTGVSVGGVR
ncbi:hypothetical protein YTPLAS18_33040 [Nitrospira sp.]|nr:hypothetical protein YTPLAS18_33040 [Nitrospira sp.]